MIDEGYFELLNVLQKDFFLVDRLKSLIENAGETPFAIPQSDKFSPEFKHEKTELREYVENLIARAKKIDCKTENVFLQEVKKFSESFVYENDCTYVFLLRDTLLPYIYFLNKGLDNVHPWLVSRRFMDLLYKNSHLDDIVRGVLIEGLERGYKDFESYKDYCSRKILQKLDSFPQAISAIKGLLNEIKSEKIVVVETGIYGTFPMLLSALDERIEFRMFTTAPYLFEVYRNQIYTTAYENIRKFETLCCQNSLFQLVDFKDNAFYVQECVNKDIITKALGEIKYFLSEDSASANV